MEMITNFFSQEFGQSLLRFVICLIVNWIFINQLYYRKSHRRDFYFTFQIITVAIFFLVTFMMNMERGKATMGVGLGLFGIFSIMRYRTDAMPVREMTYLFVVICMSVVHAMSTSLLELAIVDVIIFLAIWICEQTVKTHSTKLIQYDRIELIKPQRREELIADLEERTGLKITRVDVGGIDFLRDAVVLRITYENTAMESNVLNGQFTVNKSQWNENV